eukprot:Gb_15038 [translate_table: standard]
MRVEKTACKLNGANSSWAVVIGRDWPRIEWVTVCRADSHLWNKEMMNRGAKQSFIRADRSVDYPKKDGQPSEMLCINMGKEFNRDEMLRNLERNLAMKVVSGSCEKNDYLMLPSIPPCSTPPKIPTSHPSPICKFISSYFENQLPKVVWPTVGHTKIVQKGLGHSPMGCMQPQPSLFKGLSS